MIFRDRFGPGILAGMVFRFSASLMLLLVAGCAGVGSRPGTEPAAASRTLPAAGIEMPDVMGPFERFDPPGASGAGASGVTGDLQAPPGSATAAYRLKGQPVLGIVAVHPPLPAQAAAALSGVEVPLSLTVLQQLFGARPDVRLRSRLDITDDQQTPKLSCFDFLFQAQSPLHALVCVTQMEERTVNLMTVTQVLPDTDPATITGVLALSISILADRFRSVLHQQLHPGSPPAPPAGSPANRSLRLLRT